MREGGEGSGHRYQKVSRQQGEINAETYLDSGLVRRNGSEMIIPATRITKLARRLPH